jgi:hypothetical protein
VETSCLQVRRVREFDERRGGDKTRRTSETALSEIQTSKKHSSNTAGTFEIACSASMTKKVE